MAKLPNERPPGWEEPQLTSYLETIWSNTLASFFQKEEAHRLCRIDDLMFEIANDWKVKSANARTAVPLFMYFRAHSAFRSSACLGLGGALVEGMATLRLSIEFAGYATMVHCEPRLAQVWWDRDKDRKSQSAARTAFTHGAVRRILQAKLPQLAQIYDVLYDRAIQFGAHPNEKSITSSVQIIHGADGAEVNQIYLQGDGPALDHWIRTANQIGICILKLFAVVFADRFSSLDAERKIATLANGL